MLRKIRSIGQTAKAVCKIMRGWVPRYGLSKIIHSDNGHCFVSHTFAQFSTDHGIEHTYRSQYRLQGNAGVERLNRTMGETLCKLVNKHPRQWSEQLPDVQLPYNTATHARTGAIRMNFYSRSIHVQNSIEEQKEYHQKRS